MKREEELSSSTNDRHQRLSHSLNDIYASFPIFPRSQETHDKTSQQVVHFFLMMKYIYIYHHHHHQEVFLDHKDEKNQLNSSKYIN